jgi:hypothetical protein
MRFGAKVDVNSNMFFVLTLEIKSNKTEIGVV